MDAHGHDHQIRRLSSQRRLVWALALNLCFLVVEAVGGIMTSSLALLAAAATTPAGTLISYPLIRRVAFPELGALLALAAGALLYVGASHLLPDVEAERRGIVYLALAAGVLLAVSSGMLNH